MLPKVSIIFTNWNGGHQPLELIYSIENLNYPKNKLETIMVDNGSADGSVERVQSTNWRTKSKIQSLKIIKNETNLGFSKAINLGIKNSTGDFIFVTNDDFLFSKDSLKILIQHSLKYPKVGIISGKVFFKAPKEGLTNSAWKLNLFTGQQKSIGNVREICEVDWISGAGMLFSRSLVEKIGLFDEGFSPAYFEDVDFCFRARRAGFKTIYHPKAVFYHFQEASIDKLGYPKYLYLGQRSKIRFFFKHANLIQVLTFLLCQYLIAIPYRKFKSKYKNPLPEIKALIYNFIHLPQTLKSRNEMFTSNGLK